jgi:para-nitrobenzyl esterase
MPGAAIPADEPDASRRALLSMAGAAPLLAFASFAHAAAPPTAVASTQWGRVRGEVRDGVHVFRGIRYGADTRPLRFRPPATPAPWNGIADALAFGPACPQPSAAEPTSEDCLFLNVCTTTLDAGARQPVLVYIHGGAYSSGSGSSPLYDGRHLVERGEVVVVTLNHRLNAFGYLYLDRVLRRPDLADSGNAGQLDLVLALSWVRDNIVEFGGDPGCVTVFGQSGGGAKIATLLATPAAAGLFQRAATMSGQQVTASGPLNATVRTRALLEALHTVPQRVADVLTIPTAEIVDALGTTDPVIGRGHLYFGPVLDERSLARHPFFPDSPAQASRMPMIVGNTLGETRNLIGRGDPSAFELRWEELPDRLATEMRVDVRPETVVAEYRRLYPQASASEIFFRATTASRSWRGALIELEARARDPAPTYAYQLDWPSPVDGGRWGACHGLDIPLVFGTLSADGSLTGDGDEAQRVSRQMGDAFLAFARSGDPNHAGLPQWQPYRLPDRATLVFDVESRLALDPRRDERRLFERVPFIQQGT